jgi:hypothetical protein
MKKYFIAATAAVAMGSAATVASANYVNNFDVDTTASWTVNDTGIGTNDANFFFDYSTVGIPSAPNSVGGTTRGLRIRSNIGAAPASGIPGISVSPTGQSFTGNYTLKFDWWSNYLGPLGVGATGSTMMTNFGVMTSGTTANSTGVSDAVFFSATGDGQNAADYRAYSSERPVSYQIPGTAPEDAHATHFANSRNSSATYYATPFPGGKSAPGSQASITSQSGTTPVGSAGFQWNQVEIRVVNGIATWAVNGTDLISVDTTSFTTPVGGTNILFGYSDINTGTNTTDANFPTLQFGLIDNVQVVVPEPTSMAAIGLAGLSLLARRRRA